MGRGQQQLGAEDGPKYLVTPSASSRTPDVAQAVTPQIALTGAIVSQASRSAATGGNVEIAPCITSPT